MALLAEEIVEEWLNRNGWFTIRGIKLGVGEIDLLAIKPSGQKIVCRHIEVQASINPISYLTPLSKKEQKAKGLSPNSAKKRPMKLLKEGVELWIHKKFYHPKKEKLRQKLIDIDVEWSKELVVHKVKYPEELSIIRKHGVVVHNLLDIVKELALKKSLIERTAGGDLVDLILLRTLKNGKR